MNLCSECVHGRRTLALAELTGLVGPTIVCARCNPWVSSYDYDAQCLYTGRPCHPGYVQCMLTGWTGGKREVSAVHLLPSTASRSNLVECELKPEQLEHPRNALLLSNNIRRAYNRQRLSFILPNPLHKDRMVLKCWDPTLVDEPAWPDATCSIQSYDGQPLHFSPYIAHRPFRRLLYFQAVYAWVHAVQAGWSPDAPPRYIGASAITKRLQLFQSLLQSLEPKGESRIAERAEHS